jgi:hypothetical protein
LAHLQGLSSGRDLEHSGGPVGFELVGDSHAIQYFAGLSQLMKQQNTEYEILTSPGCPMLVDVTLKGRDREQCRSWRDQTMEHLGQTNLPLVYAQRWEIYNEATTDFAPDTAGCSSSNEEPFAKLQLAIEKTIGELVGHGRRILIIGDQVKASCAINRPRLLQGPLPHTPVPPCAATKREVAEQSTAPINLMLSRMQAKWPDQVELLRPADYFCDTECPVVKDGIWLYFDRTHFSVAGSRYMAAQAADVFRNFLEPKLR